MSTAGRQNLGSGVVIAADKVATNCHVVRNARKINIIVPEGVYPVDKVSALPQFDACILATNNLNIPVAELANTETMEIGDTIVVVGFPFGQGMRMATGNITELHPFPDDPIIEINAGFNHGASGGGVFNNTGNLIGLMTFMGPESGSIHFYAIPSSWLVAALDNQFLPVKPFLERSFWEKGEFKKR
jgi:S1-C subfamily serine protease